MEKILIVDDTKENLFFLEDLLKSDEIETIRANTGYMAVELSLEHDFSLVLLDIQMPGIDGYKTLELIRKQDKNRHIPVILMSAIFTDELHIIKGMDTGAVDFLIKPLIPEILEGKVKVFLELQNQKKELQKSLQNEQEINNRLNLEIQERKAIEVKLKQSEEQLRESNQQLEEANRSLKNEIEERELAQKHILEQSRLLDLVFKYSLDSLVLLDKDYNFIRVSESYARVCQKASHEFPGNNHFDFYPSDLKNEFDEAVKNKVIYKRLARPFIFPDRPELGVSYWNLGLVTVRDKNKDVELFIFTLKDVSEQIRTEIELEQYKNQLEELVEERTKLLKESEEKYRLISENSEDIIAVFLSTGKLLYLSPSVKKVLNYDVEEFENENVKTRIAPLLPIDENILKGDTFIDTYPLKSKNGKIKYIEVISRAISKDENGVVKILSIGRDITARHEAEKKLSTYTQRLRKQRNELNTMNEQLAKASRLKDEFLASMSHELRTPLNAILGYTKLLCTEKEITPELKQSLNIIEKSGEYLLIIINDILNLAKIEAGKMDIQPSFFSLSYFLEHIINSFEIRAIEKKLNFIFNNKIENTIWVTTDENKLRQILFNLLSNAVKFTDEGTLWFTASIINNKFRFEVKDTGIGIEKEHSKDIFTPFVQVGEQRFYTEGTGLGLSISNKLAQMLGGQLYMKSKIGKGSTFWLDIDLKIQNTELTSDNNPKKKITAYKGNAKTVLIADDDIANRDILKKYLSNLGFEIIEVENGEKVIEYVNNKIPDLLLLNLHMPILNGFMTLAHLKKNEKTKKIKTIAITAHVSSKMKNKCMESGFDDFISKPINFSRLKQKIKEQLKLKWEYETALKIENENDTLPTFPVNDINTLKELVQLGKIKKLLLHLDTLKKKQPQLSQAIDSIKDLSQRFELKQVTKLLTQMKK